MDDDYLSEAHHEAQLVQVTSTTGEETRTAAIQEMKEVNKQPQEGVSMSTGLKEEQKRASGLPERDVTERDSNPT